MNKEATGTLTGKFFHSVKSDRTTIEWQGQFLGLASPGLYRVQLFDWLVGAPDEQRLVPATDMALLADLRYSRSDERALRQVLPTSGSRPSGGRKHKDSDGSGIMSATTLPIEQQAAKFAEALLNEGKSPIDTTCDVFSRFKSNGLEFYTSSQIVTNVQKSIAAKAAASATAEETSAETEPAGNLPRQPEVETGPAVVLAPPVVPINNNPGVLATADPLPCVPSSLKIINNWVRWKLETVNGKPTKVPYQVNGYKASTTNPATWADYRTAVTGATIDGKQGVGFVLNGNIYGFDLDGCYNSETNEVADWALQIVDALDSYAEITPSGTGLRVLVRGELPQGFAHMLKLNPAIGHGDKVQIEIYNDARYFTVTGDTLYENAGEVEKRDLSAAYQLCLNIHEQHPAPKKEAVAADGTPSQGSQAVQIEKVGDFGTTKYDIFMSGAIESQTPFIISNGNGRLEYPSQSEADMAFATVLAIKYDRDREKISTDFRNSKLYRAKWDRLEEPTITKAIESATKLKEQHGDLKLAQQPAPAVQPAVPAAEEPEEDFGDRDAEPFPECPIFTGVLTDLARVLYPSIPIEFKMWALITRWGLLRSGVDTLAREPHLQPRFQTSLICLPWRGKTAAINESRTAMNMIVTIATSELSNKDKARPFGKVLELPSVDSGQFLVDQFWSHWVEIGSKDLREGRCSDINSKIMIDPDELSDLFEKAKTSGNIRTRCSTNC